MTHHLFTIMAYRRAPKLQRPHSCRRPGSSRGLDHFRPTRLMLGGLPAVPFPATPPPLMATAPKNNRTSTGKQHAAGNRLNNHQFPPPQAVRVGEYSISGKGKSKLFYKILPDPIHNFINIFPVLPPENRDKNALGVASIPSNTVS